MTIWPEGDELIAAADQYLVQVHEHRGRPLFVVGNRWRHHETAVNTAYATRDPDRLKAALRSYARHALACFLAAQRAASFSCPACGAADYRPLRGGGRRCSACGRTWRGLTAAAAEQPSPVGAGQA